MDNQNTEEINSLRERNRRLELKTRALQESLQNKVSSITSSYEDQVTDLRVELTIALEDLQAAREVVNAFNERNHNAVSQEAADSEQE